jgi:DNA-damage-inducible protein J
MNKTASVSVRVRPELKARAEKIFEQLGLSPTDAITMFYSQVSLRQGIPFPVEIPNAATMKAIKDADAGIDVHKVNDVDELFSEIGV